MGFRLNIKGQLNSIHLAEAKALWPLFEAVVNSIQSIEDSPNKTCGKIEIYAQREDTGEIRLDDGKPDKDEPLEKFESFTIADNGLGFNTKNYESFQTAYSMHKISKGCKGIGRFLWLKAFDSVEIKSVFAENGKFYNRTFSFTADGIEPEDDNLKETESQENCTQITLKNFMPRYRNAAPVELNVVAKKIIEHCLLFFVTGNCPEIVLRDDQKTINLNRYFDEKIKDSICQDKFSVKEKQFRIYHLHFPSGVMNHELHLSANMQDVCAVDLKKYIPNLQKKIAPENGEMPFYYVGYITSPYLDSIVNTTRTEFDFDERHGQTSLFGVSEEDILSTAVEFVKAYLSDDLKNIDAQKRDEIDRFVAEERPTYRYMLHKRPNVYDEIPANLKPEALELELHKQLQKWEREIKKQSVELEEAAKEAVKKEDASYKKVFETYWESITEISKTSLAEYVTRRKTLLKLLEDALTVQKNGLFKKEEVIHSLICPMQHTSNDVQFEEMNLWVIDERLAYHKFLASDKTLKSMPLISSESCKEPDIAVFDHAFAYSDSDEPFNSVTIIEFKKPDNDNKNPINQVGEYVNKIRQGLKKKLNGQSFNVTEGTVFRCYIICDLTDKMRTHCKNSSLLVTPDNLGYSGYNQSRHSYIEVISYEKLLGDAKKRNEIFFEKLFGPMPGKMSHMPEK